MKATLSLLLLAPAAIFVSCAPTQDNTPVAPAAQANPYGVPTQPGGYVPEAAPYQPVDPINPPSTPSTYTPPAPALPTPPPPPTLNGNVYTIKKGDSLWGLARKYGTSVEAIKQLNGMTSDTIVDGRTLIIPGR